MKLLIDVTFTESQIKELLKNIVILIDSREKNNDHIIKYFNQNGIKYEITKLDQGDYSCYIDNVNEITLHLDIKQISFINKIVIERKNSLEELSSNFAEGRTRFENEFIRCKEKGIKPYLLIENAAALTDIYYNDYKTEYTQAAFSGSLLSFIIKYNINLIQTYKDISPKILKDILYYFVRNYLKNG